MAGEKGEQVAGGCFQAEADPAGRMVRAESFKAGEQRLRRGAHGRPTRQRLSAGELAEIDFLIGAIESDDQGKAWRGFGIHGQLFCL